jgi:hypothetical protein
MNTVQLILAIPIFFIVAVLATVSYAELKKTNWEIKSKSGKVIETVALRGGPWPGALSDIQKLHFYAEYAAISEDAYDRKIPTIKPTDDWKRIEREALIKASGEPMSEWAKFFPRDEKDIRAFAFKMWKKELPDRIDVVIAFRGTDDNEDWKSTFRWFKGKAKRKDDQYELVKQLIPKLVPAVHKLLPNRNINFISTGHSLGASLAQQAAYAMDCIKEVCAFDATPITGYYSTDNIKKNSMRIKIDRVYERGEGAAYTRALLRPFYGLSPENPNITEIGFNFEKVGKGNWWLYFVRQHGMTDLAKHLIELDKKASVE